MIYDLSEQSFSRSKNEEKTGLKRVAIKNLLQENWSNFCNYRENTTTERLQTLAVS